MEKSKIRKLFYTIREEAYPKDDAFLNNKKEIKIKLNENMKIQILNNVFVYPKRVHKFYKR